MIGEADDGFTEERYREVDDYNDVFEEEKQIEIKEPDFVSLNDEDEGKPMKSALALKLDGVHKDKDSSKKSTVTDRDQDFMSSENSFEVKEPKVPLVKKQSIPVIDIENLPILKPTRPQSAYNSP